MVIQGFPPKIGGAELQLRRLLPFLAQRGVTATVLTRAYGRRPRRERLEGALVVRDHGLGRRAGRVDRLRRRLPRAPGPAPATHRRRPRPRGALRGSGRAGRDAARPAGAREGAPDGRAGRLRRPVPPSARRLADAAARQSRSLRRGERRDADGAARTRCRARPHLRCPERRRRRAFRPRPARRSGAVAVEARAAARASRRAVRGPVDRGEGGGHAATRACGGARRRARRRGRRPGARPGSSV